MAQDLSPLTSKTVRRFGTPASLIVAWEGGPRLLAAHGIEDFPEGFWLEAFAGLGPPAAPAASRPAAGRARFLALAPLPGAAGGAALCALDFRERQFPPTHLRLLGLYAEEAAAALGLETGGETVLDEGLGVHAPAFLRRLLAAEIDASGHCCALALRLERMPEIVREQGSSVARRLLLELSRLLRSRLRLTDTIGLLSETDLAVLLPETPLDSLPFIWGKLHLHLRENFRFSLRLGAVSGAEPGQAWDLLAESVAQKDAGVRLYAHGKWGGLPLGGQGASRAPQAASTALQERYQKLLLLNHIAVDLFSHPTLEAALEPVSHAVLALCGAKHLSVYRREESGRFALAHGGGDKTFSEEGAQEARAEILSQTLAQEGTLWSPRGALGYLGVPIPGAESGDPPEGVLLAGYLGSDPPSEEIRRLMADVVARLFRNTLILQRQLRQQKILAAVTAQAADPILLTDLQGRILAWNRGAEETFQYAAADVLGKRLQDFFLPPGQETQESLVVAETLERSSVHGREGVRLRRDGLLIPVEMTLTLLRDADGTPFGMVRILRDITRRKEIDRLKSDFVNVVSHELRTPMTSIQGFVETLFEYWGELPEGQKKKYLLIILEESKRLSRLVTDFLDVSRLESGGFRLRLQPLDLKALAERVLETLGPGQALKVRLDAEEGLPRPLADSDQVQRVLLNLCSNAMRYSPEGGLVTVLLRRAGAGVEVRVCDQGPGIAPSEQKRLFQKFHRGADAVSLKNPGTGLGLAICKSIVEAHGGRIGVESRPGEGSTFHFVLPLEPLPPSVAKS